MLVVCTLPLLSSDSYIPLLAKDIYRRVGGEEVEGGNFGDGAWGRRRQKGGGAGLARYLLLRYIYPPGYAGIYGLVGGAVSSV